MPWAKPSDYRIHSIAAGWKPVPSNIFLRPDGTVATGDNTSNSGGSSSGGSDVSGGIIGENRVRGQVRDPQLPMHHPLVTRIDVSPPIAKNDGCCLTVRLLFAY